MQTANCKLHRRVHQQESHILRYDLTEHFARDPLDTDKLNDDQVVVRESWDAPTSQKPMVEPHPIGGLAIFHPCQNVNLGNK